MATTLQVRLDKKTKDTAQKTLKSMGLDMSSGVKLFLTQVVHTGSIPFRIHTADALPEDAKQKMVRESNAALKKGKRYVSVEELHDSM